MSSSTPPPPSRSKRLHNFDLSADVKWSSKNQTTSNATRGRRSSRSSSSSLLNQQSAHQVTPYQSTLQKPYILDWLHGNLSKPTVGSSNGGSSSDPNFNTISNFAFGSSSGSSSFDPNLNTISNFAFGSSGNFAFGSSSGSSSFDLNLNTISNFAFGSSSGSSFFDPYLNTISNFAFGSSRGSSSSHLNFNASNIFASNLPLGSSSLQSRGISNVYLQRTSSPMRFKILPSNPTSKVTSFSHPLNAFGSSSSMQGMSSVNFEEEQFDPGKMIESLTNNLLVLDKKKEGEQGIVEQLDKQEKLLKMYEKNNKKKRQGGKDDRKRKLVPRKDPKANKPIILPENKFHDPNANLWSFHLQKFNQQSHTLNLEKNMGSSFTNQRKHAEENIDKQFKAIAKSKQKSAAKNKGKRHDNQKKNKGKEQESKQEQESEIKLPELSLQLTPEEIVADLFAMMGSIPKKPKKKRGKKAQGVVDQLTPGLWLQSINANRYK